MSAFPNDNRRSPRRLIADRRLSAQRRSSAGRRESQRRAAETTGDVQRRFITHRRTDTDRRQDPKQIVRNVESALLAQLGIKVDHRKISVAQTAEVLPLEAMEDRAVAERARKRGVVFRRVEVTPTETPHRVTVTVTMERDGQELSARENAGDADKMRLLAAARATVSILDGLVTDGTIDLAGAQLSDAFDTRLAFVGIHVLQGREARLHVGTCEVKGSVEQAGALAVLDATNRWLTLPL